MTYTSELLDSLIPITEFDNEKTAYIFDKLNTQKQLIVLKDNQPTAIILSPDEFNRLSKIEEDYMLLTTPDKTVDNESSASAYSIEEILSKLGIDEEQLSKLDDRI